MGLLGWIIVGLIAGWLANMATGTRSRGCLTTMVVGIVGALLGGLIFEWAGQPGINQFNLWSILVAFVGATLLLLILHGLDRR